MSIQKGIKTYTEDKHETQSKNWFQKLIQENQYVGELYSKKNQTELFNNKSKKKEIDILLTR